MNRKIRSALCAVLAVTTMTAAASLSTVSAEWYRSEKGISYTDENGAARGWKDIDGARYYFGEDGYAVTGLQTIDGRTYYFSGDGRMKTGKLKINGKVYSFGKDGAMKEDASAKTSSAQTVVLPWGMTEKQIADRAEKYKKAGRTVTVEEHEYSRTYKIEYSAKTVAAYELYDGKLAIQEIFWMGRSKSVEENKLIKAGYTKWFAVEDSGAASTMYTDGKTAAAVSEAEYGNMKVTMVFYFSPSESAMLFDDEEGAELAAALPFDYARRFQSAFAIPSDMKKTGTSRDIIEWDISKNDLKKKMADEKKAGRDVEEYVVGDQLRYSVEEDDGVMSIYVADYTQAGMLVQEKVYIGRTLKTEDKKLKEEGFEEWKTVTINDTDITVYKNGNLLAAAAQGRVYGKRFTITEYFCPALSVYGQIDDEKTETLLKSYYIKMFESTENED